MSFASQPARAVAIVTGGSSRAGRDVARADRPGQGELPEDRKPDGIGRGLQEQDVRIGLSLHPRQCIDRFLYRQLSI
jgi:hypothetical protein